MASVLLLIIVSVLDLIAFGLAVAAEQTRSSATVINTGTALYCQYDSDVATGLGAGAFVLLLVSQLLLMWASRCLCCGRTLRPSASRAWAITLFMACWLVFFTAEVCLLSGTVQNAYHTKFKSSLSKESCRMLRKGVFGTGAAFVVFTGIISELYYVSYSKANNLGPTYREDPGVTMGIL